jgi:hypothetical protein
MTELAAWENFYVIVGSSAGALIGLQFVVITLISQMPEVRDVERGSSAFATPTIVHFASVLFVSAVISAPWRGLIGPAILWGGLGLFGMVYEIVVTRRMRTQSSYRPEFEDWVFYALIPFAAYTVLLISAYIALSHTRVATFCIGSAALLLLFVGVHNAWDGVTYHVVLGKTEKNGADEKN